MVASHITIDLERAVRALKGKREKGRLSALGRHIAARLLTAALLVAPAANAGVPVIDITSIIGDLRAWLDDTVQYAKEAKRWKEVQAQINSVRAIFDPLRFSIGLPPGATLEKVAPDYLVVEACGKGAADLRMQSAVTPLRFARREERKEREAQQRQICVNIQMMQNRKFNETVTFLERTINDAETAMHDIFQARVDSNNTTGGVQATQSDTARLTNHLNLTAQQWSTRMQAYDAYIAVMQSRQNVVARAALQGDPTADAVSDIMQTVLLEQALKIK